MRVTITKRSSTKAERIFAEILKRNHIAFKHRHRIEGREIDFIIKKYAIEIDGHAQSPSRNKWLVEQGFTPIHFQNSLLFENPLSVEKLIIQTLKLHG